MESNELLSTAQDLFNLRSEGDVDYIEPMFDALIEWARSKPEISIDTLKPEITDLEDMIQNLIGEDGVLNEVMELIKSHTFKVYQVRALELQTPA